jgi:hypothetical protein
MPYLLVFGFGIFTVSFCSDPAKQCRYTMPIDGRQLWWNFLKSGLKKLTSGQGWPIFGLKKLTNGQGNCPFSLSKSLIFGQSLAGASRGLNHHHSAFRPLLSSTGRDSQVKSIATAGKPAKWI